MSANPNRSAAPSATCRSRWSARRLVPAVRASGSMPASARERRRCVGCGLPRAASAAAFVNAPERTHFRPISEPERAAGSRVRRCRIDAARSARVPFPSSGSLRSSPNASW